MTSTRRRVKLELSSDQFLKLMPASHFLVTTSDIVFEHAMACLYILYHVDDED